MDTILPNLKEAIKDIEDKIGDVGGWELNNTIDEQTSLLTISTLNQFTANQFKVTGLDMSNVYTTYKKINDDYCIGLFHDVDSECSDNVFIFIGYSSDMYPSTNLVRELNREIHNYITLK